MILQKLKIETLEAHRATERLFYGKEIMSGALSKAQYSEMLQKNHYIFRQLEPLLQNSFTRFFDKEVEFIPQLGRAQLMVKDLEILHSLKQNYEVNLPEVEKKTQFIGALYVVEGSMLGGMMIGRKLAENENLPDAENLHFYNPNNKNTGKRWKSFRDFVARVELKEEDFADVKKGALDTFGFFQKVYAQ